MKSNTHSQACTVMTDQPKPGQLRAWHIPQIPGKPFRVAVSDLREAAEVLHLLAEYDLFQYENRIKPDYASASGLEIYDPENDGDLGYEYGWCEWHSTEGLDICDHMRNGDDVEALVWEGDGP